MTMSLYDTVALIAVVENLKPPSRFLLDMFFPNVATSDTEFVAIDVFNGKRRLAPFCSPLVQGKLVEGIGYTTTEFKPAYVKDKRHFDPKRAVRRAIGERIGGTMAPMERVQANLGFELQDQIAMVNRRLEWMAASALALGTITVAGDGYETTVITFGRDAGQTLTLSGGNRWGQSGVSPMANIETWSATMLKNSGLVVTDVVFTVGAWDEFKKDTTLLSVLQQTGGVVPRDVNIPMMAPEAGGQYMGTINGYRLWRYSEWYVDPADNVEKPMIADNTVILCSTALQGAQAFASIMDEEFNYQALPYAPKSWLEKDPAVRWLMMQSAPLVIPTNVNGSFAVVVK